jgi:hypothetical protein
MPSTGNRTGNEVTCAQGHDNWAYQKRGRICATCRDLRQKGVPRGVTCSEGHDSWLTASSKAEPLCVKCRDNDRMAKQATQQRKRATSSSSIRYGMMGQWHTPTRTELMKMRGEQ